MLDEPALIVKTARALVQTPDAPCWSSSRACASSTATAHDPMRVRGPSARLVNMMGARAENHARRIGDGEECELFGEHVAAPRSGTTRISAWPATGATIPFSVALRTDGVVERERPVQHRR